MTSTNTFGLRAPARVSVLVRRMCARSVYFGNPNSEARNPKQNLNSNIECSKQDARSHQFCVLSSKRFRTFGFWVSNLFRISDFDFRIWLLPCRVRSLLSVAVFDAHRRQVGQCLLQLDRARYDDDLSRL